MIQEKKQKEVLLLAIKSKNVISIVTTLAIVGVTVYVIKKYYDSKKQEQNSISLEEAKQIVESLDHTSGEGMENVVIGSEGEVSYIPNLTSHNDTVKFRLNGDETDKLTKLDEDEMTELIDESREMANFNSSFSNPNGPIGIKPEELAAGREIEEEEEATWYEGPDPQEVHDSKGYFDEDKELIDELRYEHNSPEAMEQYINMELVVLGRDNDTRDIVSMLYDHPFVPLCDEDENLKVRLIDHRIKFFGMTSKWITEVSFGDVIMYYGKSAEYNCGNDVRYWVDYFLTCADLNNITLTSDEIEDTVRMLNTHNFFNEDLQSHGMFGLSSAQMTEAIVVARTRIDERVTYDIEFNQFVQGVI